MTNKIVEAMQRSYLKESFQLITVDGATRTTEGNERVERRKNPLHLLSSFGMNTRRKRSNFPKRYLFEI